MRGGEGNIRQKEERISVWKIEEGLHMVTEEK